MTVLKRMELVADLNKGLLMLYRNGKLNCWVTRLNIPDKLITLEIVNYDLDKALIQLEKDYQLLNKDRKDRRKREREITKKLNK
jgi:hypothetical protein